MVTGQNINHNPMETFIEKYSPKSIDEFILDPQVKQIIKQYIAKKSIPNLLLAGNQGIGKSCLSKLIARELDAEVLYINASVTSGVDLVRTQILEFSKVMISSDRTKIVILDEADSLSKDTGNSSAQDALRNVIDSSLSDTRYILTCNWEQKITGPLKSRCTPIRITFPKKEVIALVANILKAEKIETTLESFQTFCSEVIDVRFPDIRSILNVLEMSIQSGKLAVSKTFTPTNLEIITKEIFTMLKNKDNVMVIRKYYLQQSDKIKDDWAVLSGLLFDIFSKSEYNQRVGEILSCIAEYNFKIQTIEINKEIQFCSMIQRILQT